MDFKRKKADEPTDWRTQPLAEPTQAEPIQAEPRQAGPDPEELTEPQPTGWRGWINHLLRLLHKSRQLIHLYGGLGLAFLVFYALADYTAFTTAEQRPGQLIFSNTMTQLWTACFRLAFVLGASLGLLRLFWPELFRFFRPDIHDGPDMMATIKNELTPYQRLCVFLLAFFGLCALFIALLSVNLPQTISVGR